MLVFICNTHTHTHTDTYYICVCVYTHIRGFIFQQNGSIMEGLRLWKRNIDKRIEGVEECFICYAVIHATSYNLPRVPCRTCKKKFHSACLVSTQLLCVPIKCGHLSFFSNHPRKATVLIIVHFYRVFLCFHTLRLSRKSNIPALCYTFIWIKIRNKNAC